jgi:hypothetical protein
MASGTMTLLSKDARHRIPLASSSISLSGSRIFCISRPQLAILFAEPRQFLVLGGGQAGPAARAIGVARLTHSRTAVSGRSMSRATAPTEMAVDAGPKI